jgi:hypothetical protein
MAKLISEANRQKIPILSFQKALKQRENAYQIEQKIRVRITKEWSTMYNSALCILSDI